MVAAASSIVVVNTVNYVRDELGGTQADVAWMLATAGGGTLIVAVMLPPVLDRVADRTVMLTGAITLLIGLLSAVTMALARLTEWAVTAPIWAIIGAGMALIVTPIGRVLRASVTTPALPAAFAAQFSLSHMAWLVTYPIAGWVATNFGFPVAWSILAALAILGTLSAVILWPREKNAETLETEPAMNIPGEAVLTRDGALSGEGALAASQCACVKAV